MAMGQRRVHWVGRWLRKFQCRGRCSLFVSPAPPALSLSPCPLAKDVPRLLSFFLWTVEGTTSCLTCQANLAILNLALTICWSLQILKGS